MYSRGKIYELVCNKTGNRYVGSTCEPTLARRLSSHVAKFKRWKLDKKVFMSSFIILEEGDYVINLLEMCPVNCKDELRMREQFYINLLENINKQKAFRTKNEIAEYHKMYYQENKTELIEKRKEYRDQNSEKIAEKDKMYYQQNKAKLTEKHKKYYQQNSEKIIQKRRERQASQKIIDILT